MNVMIGKTDAELAELDVVSLLRTGLDGGARGELFGNGAVAGAIQLDRAGVLPRSVSFLAEIVRSGGTGYAAALAEPLPVPSQSEVIQPWLNVAAATGDDETFARWLQAVSAVLDLRRSTRDG